MATNMTNSEEMVTSAAYTTEYTQKYPLGMSEARHGAVLLHQETRPDTLRASQSSHIEMAVPSTSYLYRLPE